ncbi:MAG: endonuclease/exonuclease/phosphatase family protein [Chlorobi bacterium]|nr:endonuclease/exonuclease/phosphatase family protein [Chlorobiota bacterium]
MAKKTKYKLLKLMFAAANTIVAVLLAFSLPASFTHASDYPFIAVLGLYYPVILIVNLIFMLFWLFVKKRYVIISAVVIFFGISNLAHTFNFSINNNTETDSMQIKVLSYNVRQFQADDKFTKLIVKNDILSFIVKQKADIVCLQEFQSHNKNIYEPLKKIRDTLNSGTYYYESYYSPRYNYLTGLVIFSKNKAVNKGKLKFEGSRTFAIYTDLLINDDTLRVFNIHLASISLTPSDIDFVVKPEVEDNKAFRNKATEVYSKLTNAFILRQKQAELLAEEIKGSPFKILLAGDFNDTPSSFVYKNIEDLLVDAFSEKGLGMGISYAGKIPFLRIDYIFASHELEILDFKKHKILRSDHYPISAIYKN